MNQEVDQILESPGSGAKLIASMHDSSTIFRSRSLTLGLPIRGLKIMMLDGGTQDGIYGASLVIVLWYLAAAATQVSILLFCLLLL